MGDEVNKKLSRLLLMLVFCFLFSFSSACSWFGSKTANTNMNANANTNTNVAKDETLPTPPFSTKEPEKFQAKMVFSAVLDEHSPDIPPQVYSISRDGNKRRVEFQQGEDMVAFLQIPSGQFVLNLTKKEYSNLDLSKLGDSQGGSSVPSLDKMLNQARPNAKYEKLGQEEVSGRMATKYRVTSQETVNAGASPNEKITTDSLIWIDESLGMPIRSETTTTGEDGGKVKIIMEVKEIKLETPSASSFEIPKEFKKVK